MRKPILLLSVAAMFGMSATARSLSPTEALGRVTNIPVSRSGGAAPMTPVLTVGSADAPALYVFNKAEGGWMIVGADDVAAPLIAYSNTGTFDPANMPDNFKGWLEQYSTEIREASAAGAEAYSATTSRAASDRTPIAPLVKTQWNQNNPYNKYCPQSYMTGCVATAMAQVMKYHNWPKKASADAKFSYTWLNTKTTLTADFSDFEFDWDNMLNEYDGVESYNSTQADAVANLMKACGYSVRMNYHSLASAAYSELVGGALVNYFGYDAGLHNEFRDLHTAKEWDEMIYDNLKNVGPMVYWGQGGGGAHSFVCDGYDGNGYYHFNWGWSGQSDGYYLLTALNPPTLGVGGGTGGGFNSAQGALLGVKPAGQTVSPKRYTFRINELTSADTGTGTTYLTIRGDFVNVSPFNVTGSFKYRVYSEDGSMYITSCPVYTNLNNWGISDIGQLERYYHMMGALSAIPDGTYRVYPAVAIDGEEHLFQAPPSIAGYVLVTKKSGAITNVTIPSTGEILAQDLNTHGDLYLGSPFKFSGIAKFTGNGDTNKNIIPCLLKLDGTVCGTGNWFSINFADEGTPFELINDYWFSPTGDAISAGDYLFGLAIAENGAYKVISSIPVTVKGRVLTPTFKGDIAVENADAVDPENIKISATFEGENGIFYNSIIFTIKYNGNKVWEGSTLHYISAGQTSTASIYASLPNATPGARYSVVASRNNRGGYEAVTPEIYFTIGDKSGIADVEIDNNAPVEYFNLQGIRVDCDNLVPGIYIRRQGSKTTKILVK